MPATFSWHGSFARSLRGILWTCIFSPRPWSRSCNPSTCHDAPRPGHRDLLRRRPRHQRARGCALFLPFTFYLDPISGLLALVGIYCGTSFPARLRRLPSTSPGTPARWPRPLTDTPCSGRGRAPRLWGQPSSSPPSEGWPAPLSWPSLLLNWPSSP